MRAPTSRDGCGGRGGAWLRSEAGFVAGAEALILGVLVFVVGTLVAVNAWGVIDAKFATSAAAREAVRAAVESEPAADLQARARQAAEATLAGHGRDPGGMTVVALGATTLERCAEVGFRVETTVPAIALLGRRSPAAFTVGSEHHELVDPYRSGLPVDPDEGATCVF